jgi:Spy/CpxP family protein refolding chaperone
MKRIVMFLFAVFAGTILVSAQPGQDRRSFDPEDMAKRQTEQLKELLSLNKDQEKKVFDLNLETSRQMRALREDNRSSGGGFEGMREKMGEIRDKQDAKMKEILTDAQWKKYQKYQEERRQQRGQRRPGSR